jgi:GR25 family glycosyltransferase involved in LPS biosynthesis
MINYFKHKFCINLDHRTDRWAECQEEFTKHNIENVTRLSATYGNPDGLPHNMMREPILTNIGVTLSHLRILQYAKENNLDSVVIFEDDVVFVDDFNDKFNSFFPQIPNDWDMIYFSGTHLGGLESISENVWRTFGTWTTHSYIINKSVYDLFIEKFSLLEDVVDVTYAQKHPYIKSYMFLPHITYQRAGISDIQGTYVDYDEIKNLC